MGKLLDKFTDPNNLNAPRYQCDEKSLWIRSPVFLGADRYEYVLCEDRLGRSGVWLYWGPPIFDYNKIDERKINCKRRLIWTK